MENGNGSKAPQTTGTNGNGGMTDSKGRVNTEPAMVDWLRASNLNLAMQRLRFEQNVGVAHSNPTAR